MSMNTREARFFAQHHGVISFTEATHLGISASAIDRRVQSGQWHRMHRGVYRVASSPVTWEVKARAATLSTGGALSHRGAARLWGLDGYERSRIELVVSEGRQRRETAFVLHQSRQFDRAAVRTRRAIAVTGIDRTVLDLAAVVSATRLGTTLDDVLRRKLTTWERIAAALAAHSRRGRNGCGPLRRLMEERYGSATPDSAWNRLCGDLLIAHGLGTPEFEHEVSVGAGRVARIDVAYPAQRIAIECDSRRFHDNDASFERDRKRHNQLVAAGWTVVMITWKMFTQEPDRVVDDVAAALRNSPTWSPAPGQ